MGHKITYSVTGRLLSPLSSLKLIFLTGFFFFFPECGLKVLKYLEEFKKKTKKIIAYF